MRYTMQMAEVATPVPDGDLTEAIVASVGRDFETATSSSTARAPASPTPGCRSSPTGCEPSASCRSARAPAPRGRQRHAGPRGHGRFSWTSSTGWQPTQIYHYADLAAGHELSGPAVVEAPTTTVAIPAGCPARVDRLGNLVIRFSGQEAAMPIIPVAGSERFATQPKTPAQIRESVKGVPLHDIPAAAVADLDPLTYEVVRHRLTAITEEMGDALKRMSGSVVVTDCNDFGTAIFDEGGDSVQVGLVNTQLAASLDMAVKWTLENRAGNPGIGPGDMFFCNDPWVGGGLHQNDASIFAPLFYDGELFAWTGQSATRSTWAACRRAAGRWRAGTCSGSRRRCRRSRWSEAGTLRADIEDLYLRRSRVPKLIALDLRAKIGANNVAQDRLTRLIDKYGPTAVKAVMRHMMNDSEARLRAKLPSLPDGTWNAVGHQDGARAGDRAIYKIVCSMTKRADRLTFDFTGTDPQVEGFANCTLAGLRGGIMPIVLRCSAAISPGRRAGCCAAWTSSASRVRSTTAPSRPASARARWPRRGPRRTRYPSALPSCSPPTLSTASP